jgi:putative SOS response-associated peptidase YedK
MCGRFTLAVEPTQMAAQFTLAEALQLAPRYNIAPTQPVAVVREQSVGRELVYLRWGLVPSWAKDVSIGAKMINARAETVAEKPSFRTALRLRRCLIPVSGFYEWQALPSGKQPFYFHLASGAPFAFAGLWERWHAPDGTPLESCTILTTTANDLLRPLHDRMPVILDPDNYARWLDPDLRTAEALADLLVPYDPAAMAAYPVGREVNRVANEGVGLIAPLA